jgi:hypothetical protein
VAVSRRPQPDQNSISNPNVVRRASLILIEPSSRGMLAESAILPGVIKATIRSREGARRS